MTDLEFTFVFILASCVFSQAGYTQDTTAKTSQLTQEATRLRQEVATGLQTFLKSHINDLT
ncbi:hypothetical protein [Trichormus azollae]|uniref:hypothetical protein n=1 Tax=Trichormus azollae TaxID=1164 RepID=UPI0001958F86